MTKLNRVIFLRFKASDNLIKDLGLTAIYNLDKKLGEDSVIEKKTIEFHPMETPDYKKDIDTVLQVYHFSNYKDLYQRVEYLFQYPLYSLIISDDNKNSFKSKTFQKIEPINETGIKLDVVLKESIILEDKEYELKYTKSKYAKKTIKKIMYYGDRI